MPIYVQLYSNFVLRVKGHAGGLVNNLKEDMKLIIAKVAVDMSTAKTEFCAPLPVGASGLKVEFLFTNSAWNNLAKTVVFRNQSTTYDAVLVDNCATIPHELLTNVMDSISVGIYGTDSEDSLAIPTLWAELGEISSAANPSGESSAEPTFPYWVQIKEQLDSMQQEMMDQQDLEDALQRAKESGEFDGPQGVKGDQGPQGLDGKDGYSPVAGVDYWTTKDQEEIVIRAAQMTDDTLSETYSIICENEGCFISLADSAERSFHGLRIYGKTSLDSAHAPDMPAEFANVGKGGVDIMIFGKNLLKNNGKTQSVNGILFTVNDDGSVIVSGTATAQAGFLVSDKRLENGKYILNGSSTNVKVFAVLRYENGTPTYFNSLNGSDTGFTIDDSVLTMGIIAQVSEGTILTGETVYPMIRYASSTSRAYEPYKEVQVLTLPAPDGLPGIPVERNGNYIDNGGQQYLVHVGGYIQEEQVGELKTTGYIESYAGEEISGEYLSSTGGLDMGASVIYALSEPIFVPYDADVQEKWKGLHTNKPNTTVYNDAGAVMKVSYVADPKTYIDNKFAELATALVYSQ